MKEQYFAKEPFDCRLMLLRLIRCIHIPVLAAVVGALLLGGGYYLWNGHLSGEDQYRIVSEYEVTYAVAPETGNTYTYINGTTWNSWMTSDVFGRMVLEEYEAAGYARALTAQDLERYLAATLASDLGMPSTIVTTPDEELTIHLNQALQKAMLRFGEEKIEIAVLRVVDTDGPTLVDRTPRTVQASILGAVSGTLFVLFVMFVKFCLSGAIWIPETFSFRHGIPVVGTLAEEEAALCESEAVNLQYLVQKLSAQKLAVTAVEPALSLKDVADRLPKLSGVEYVCVPSAEQVPEAFGVLREADGVLLVVEAGVDAEGRIRHLLEQMKLQDVTVDAVLLWGVDRKLMRLYYGLPI